MKRAKLFLTFGALGLWTLALGQDAKPDTSLLEKSLEPLLPGATQAGRFQLFNAQEYPGAAGPQVLRIDTATGQVWSLSTSRFNDGTKSGVTLQAWLAVAEKEGFQFLLDVQRQQERKEKR